MNKPINDSTGSFIIGDVICAMSSTFLLMVEYHFWSPRKLSIFFSLAKEGFFYVALKSVVFKFL